MYLNVRGLVVRATEYKERDLLLTLLTQEHGRITVKARNVRRRNCPLSAACQLLALSEFTLFDYRGNYVVNDAHVIELFSGLRQDVLKLALGTYFSQVAGLISQEDIPSSELQPLVLNCLYALSSLGVPEDKVKAVFELRAACLAGFAPDLSACAGCGCDSPSYFDVSAGLLECSDCTGLGDGGLRMPLPGGVLDAMRYICYCNPKKLFSFSLNGDGLHVLSGITEVFLTTQLERGFSALDLYKSLSIEAT